MHRADRPAWSPDPVSAASRASAGQAQTDNTAAVRRRSAGKGGGSSAAYGLTNASIARRYPSGDISDTANNGEVDLTWMDV